VRHSEDIKEYIQAALSPAEISQMQLIADEKRVNIIVDEDQLSLAIGKYGQNVRLASKLVGWELDIYSAKQWEENKKPQIRHSQLLKCLPRTVLRPMRILKKKRNRNNMLIADLAKELKITELFITEKIHSLKLRSKDGIEITAVVEMILRDALADEA